MRNFSALVSFAIIATVLFISSVEVDARPLSSKQISIARRKRHENKHKSFPLGGTPNGARQTHSADEPATSSRKKRTAKPQAASLMLRDLEKKLESQVHALKNAKKAFNKAVANDSKAKNDKTMKMVNKEVDAAVKKSLAAAEGTTKSLQNTKSEKPTAALDTVVLQSKVKELEGKVEGLSRQVREFEEAAYAKEHRVKAAAVAAAAPAVVPTDKKQNEKVKVKPEASLEEEEDDEDDEEDSEAECEGDSCEKEEEKDEGEEKDSTAECPKGASCNDDKQKNAGSKSVKKAATNKQSKKMTKTAKKEKKVAKEQLEEEEEEDDDDKDVRDMDAEAETAALAHGNVDDDEEPNADSESSNFQVMYNSISSSISSVGNEVSYLLGLAGPADQPSQAELEGEEGNPDLDFNENSAADNEE